MGSLLTFGDLTFPGQVGTADIDVLGNDSGTNWGAAEGLVKAVEAFLQDGAISSTERFGTRDLALRIRIKAPDSLALATAEAAIVAERRKCDPLEGVNLMSWTPPDGAGPTSVFEVVAARLDHDYDDQAEVGYSGRPPLYRYYALTLTAQPFARSVDPVTVDVPAPPPAVTTTVVDDGSSTAGWTGSGAVATVGGQVQTSGSQRTNLILNPSFEVDTSNWFWILSGGSLARVAGTSFAGSACLRTTAGQAIVGFGMGVISSQMPVTPGVTYTAQARVRAATTPRNVAMRIDWYNSGGSLIASGTTAVVADSVGAWTLLSVTQAAPAGAQLAAVRIESAATGDQNNGEQHYIDAVMLEAAAAAGAYFDGSTAAAGDTTHAWTGTPNNSASTETTVTSLTRSGLAVSMATTPYLKVIAGGGGGITDWLINGNPVTVVQQSGTSYWLDASAIATLNTLKAKFASTALGWIDDVSKTNATVPGGTGRENARQVAVAGSARAVASLSLADAAAGLGTALVHTTSEDTALQPDLRKYLVAGPAITADGTVVSGSTSDLSTQHWFDIPANAVPAGGYLLLARVKHAAAGARTITWSGRSRMGGADVGTVQSGTRSVTLVAGAWTVVTVAALSLPTTRVGANGLVRVGLLGPAGLLIDEAWLFDVENGRLTWVEAGTSKRLWLDTASVDDPVPSLWRGNNADRSDAIHAGADAQSWGVHEFVPPLAKVFTVTTGSTAALLSLSHYPRWHTHAAS